MKKALIIGALFLFPTLAFAQGFTTNLSYGSTGADVSALQEFLVTQHLLDPQYVTGNFYSITLAAVKAFQSAETISPVSGFVGPITRGTINTILSSQVSDSEENASTTTLPVDLSQIPAPSVTYNIAPVTTPTPVVSQIQSVTPTVQTPAPRNPPTITISNANSAQIVTPGTTDVVMDTFTLSVSAGDEGVSLSSIPLSLALQNGAKISDLNRCSLYDSSNTLRNGGGNVVNGINIYNFSSGNTIPFGFTDRLTIYPGTSASFTIKCDIGSSVTNGSSYAWSVPSWSVWGSLFGDSLSVTSSGNSSDNTTVSSPAPSCIDQQTAQLKANTPGIDASQALSQAIIACQ